MPVGVGIFVDRHHVVVPLVRRVVIDAAAGDHRLGVRVEEPVVDVDLVRPEVGDRAAGVFFEPAPVAELVHVLVAVLVQRFLGNLELPGPAEVLADGAVPLTVDVRDAAEQLHVGVAQELVARELIPGIAAPVMADLQQLAGLAGGAHHRARALDLVRHQLLAVDMLAGAHAGVGVLRVVEVRRRDNHRVEVGHARQHLAIVLERPGIVTELAKQALTVGPVVGPDIGDGAEADVRDLERGIEQHAALFTATDEADVEGIRAPGGGPRAGGRRRGDEHGGAEPGPGRKELAARKAGGGGKRRVIRRH